jgi:hypothetical protein
MFYETRASEADEMMEDEFWETLPQACTKHVWKLPTNGLCKGAARSGSVLMWADAAD